MRVLSALILCAVTTSAMALPAQEGQSIHEFAQIGYTTGEFDASNANQTISTDTDGLHFRLQMDALTVNQGTRGVFGGVGYDSYSVADSDINEIRGLAGVHQAFSGSDDFIISGFAAVSLGQIEIDAETPFLAAEAITSDEFGYGGIAGLRWEAAAGPTIIAGELFADYAQYGDATRTTFQLNLPIRVVRHVWLGPQIRKTSFEFGKFEIDGFAYGLSARLTF